MKELLKETVATGLLSGSIDNKTFALTSQDHFSS